MKIIMNCKKLSFQNKIRRIKGWLILFITILQFKSYSQGIANYVSNGGFESHYTCSLSTINIAHYWRSIDSIPASGAPAFYSTCYPNVPTGGVTYQWPRTGLSFGLATFLCQEPQCAPNGRQYFRNRLKTNLQAGATYCVKFFVNISDPSSYGIDGIASFFSDNSIDTITKTGIPLAYIIPQVQNPNGNIITDTMNWILVTGTFVANGTEKHLLIGNFKNDANTNKTLINPSILPMVACDVLLDDVSCIDVDLPAYAGPDVAFIPGGTVYIGRPQDVGIDEACTWYNLTNTNTPIANAAGITVTPAVTSTYIVRQDICGNIKWDTVVVHQSALGLAALSVVEGWLKLSPNPAQDFLNVSFEWSDLHKEFPKAEIFNNIGQLLTIIELNYNNNKTVIDLKELPDGVYMLSLKGKNAQTINKRFVIAH
ncbi:MAG: T9SS type A sorting domain-containing protein [Sphingobacteriaceae bacterium]|nr:T9SS type A sorting domain-containing protein [Sphingobacteriaceae bacterium]